MFTLCLPYVYPIKKAHIEIFLYVLNYQSDPGGTRTLDPLIKSQLLYQLSYGVKFLRAQRYLKFSFLKTLALLYLNFILFNIIATRYKLLGV